METVIAVHALAVIFVVIVASCVEKVNKLFSFYFCRKRQKLAKSKKICDFFLPSVLMLPVPDLRDPRGNRTKWKRSDEMEGDPQVKSGSTFPCQDKYGKVRIFDKIYKYELLTIVFKITSVTCFCHATLCERVCMEGGGVKWNIYTNCRMVI